MAGTTWHGDAFIAKLDRHIDRQLAKAANDLQAAVRRNISQPSRGRLSLKNRSIPGQFPHSNEGRLKQSIFKAKEDNNNWIVGVPAGAGVKYGLYLEEGHTFTPRKRKYMAIPWSPEAERHTKNGGTLTNFPKKLVKIQRHGRRSILMVEIADKRGRQRRKQPWIIHFILTLTATLKPRPFLKPTMAQEAEHIKQVLTAPMT